MIAELTRREFGDLVRQEDNNLPLRGQVHLKYITKKVVGSAIFLLYEKWHENVQSFFQGLLV